MMRIHDHRKPSSPVFPPSFQTEIDITLLPLQLSSSGSPRVLDATADTGPVDTSGILSSQSGEKDQSVEGGRAIKTPAEKEHQASLSDTLRQKAKEKRVEKKHREVELRRRFPEEQWRSSSKK